MQETPNLIYIKSLSDGDVEFEQKLIGIIQRELPEEIKVYEQNLKDENFMDASLNVHKIKHKISILGLTESYAIAENYEAQLRDKNLRLQTKFDHTLQQMLAFINGR